MYVSFNAVTYESMSQYRRFPFCTHVAKDRETRDYQRPQKKKVFPSRAHICTVEPTRPGIGVGTGTCSGSVLIGYKVIKLDHKEITGVPVSSERR